jgi:hypothetical protein
VRGPRSLLPVLDIEFDGLSFRERIEALSRKRRPVKEKLDAIVSQDEPKTSLSDQLLDRSCRHCFFSSPDLRPEPVSFPNTDPPQ